jgi:hypothetical protein
MILMYSFCFRALTAPITEKVWTVLDPELGDDTGAALRNHLAECMNHVGWKPCRYDCAL